MFSVTVGGRASARNVMIGRRSVQVDLDAEQSDRVTVVQSSNDDCVDEAAVGDKVPAVVSLGECSPLAGWSATELGARRFRPLRGGQARGCARQDVCEVAATFVWSTEASRTP